MSDICTSKKDLSKTPVKYFDLMVHSKEKVTRAVCFSPQKWQFVTSLNGLKNEEIECKKIRASDSNNYLFTQFLQSIESFIKLRQKGTIVRNTINSEHLEFMLYIREGKHWSCDHNPFGERKYIFSDICTFCEESSRTRQHRVDWNLILYWCCWWN